MFKPRLLRSLSVIAVSTVLAVSVIAAPPKPTKKPPTKPKTNTAQLASKGTSQLPGAWCEFGKSYTLGKNTGAINFCLTSAEYRVSRVKTDSYYTLATSGRKLLVLHGFIHNCQPAERWVSSGSLKFTAVDADSQNSDLSFIGVESTNMKLDQTIKPAQKIQCFIVLDVTGKGEIPKLMVANNEDAEAPIARYDLKGKVGKVEELFRDAKDATGATALDEAPAKLGTAYQLELLDIKIDNATFKDTGFGDRTLDEGYVFSVFSFEVTNNRDQTSYIGGSNAMYEVKLIDADGVSYEETIRAVAASSDREVDLEAGPGKTIKYRAFFTVPKGVQLKTLSIRVGESRTLNIDVSAYKS